MRRNPSPAQQNASRRNGSLSGGPTSAQGKANSSTNAIRHGLFSTKNRPVPDSDPEFKKHLRRLRRHVKPVNVLEVDMIRQYAVACWLKDRILAAAPEMAPESFNRLLTAQDHALHRALNALGGLRKGKFGPRDHKIVVTWEVPRHLRRRYEEQPKPRRCENEPGHLVDPKEPEPAKPVPPEPLDPVPPEPLDPVPPEPAPGSAPPAPGPLPPDPASTHPGEGENPAGAGAAENPQNSSISPLPGPPPDPLTRIPTSSCEIQWNRGDGLPAAPAEKCKPDVTPNQPHTHDL
jgi:hypothetical protein